MSKEYLEHIKEFFGDDVYHDDPIVKIAALKSQVEQTEDSPVEQEKQIQHPIDEKTEVAQQPIETKVLFQEAIKPEVPVKTIPIQDTDDMDAFHEQIKNCRMCNLCETRNRFVFGKGNHQSDIMIIGEAPGAEEDRQGLPFVGRAGQLLDKILAAVDLNLEHVFITNIVKCRPPNNRDPEPNEINSCLGYLRKQIEIMKPKMILSLGRVSGRTLLGQELSLSKMRGQIHNFEGIPLVITYHPSALLRNESWKRPTWDDMKMFKSKYMELKGQS
jgi:uracil-DNA glycosylase family 4